MFNMVPNRDVLSWNTIIGVLAKGEEPLKAIEFFCKMHTDGFLPNQITYLSAITSCTRLVDLTYGELIHAKIIKNQFHNSALVGSSLVDFYAKCDRLDSAQRSFDEILEKNLISWNALLLGYSNRGCSTSVLLLREMIQSADALSFFEDSKIPHSVVHSNVIAGLYNRTGQYLKTQELYCDTEDPDIVSWNVLIAACARNRDYKEAFELFQHMGMHKIPPDNYTYISLLSICTKLCNLALGSSLHGRMIQANFKRCDTMVCNVMIDMYGKCGSLQSSVTVFDDMKEKNVISWTAMISAFGLHGRAREALEMFREMEMFGIKPDKVSFVAALSACRHVGLVKEGMELFEEMKGKYGIQPQIEHYLLVVDLMARYGHLKEAEQLISGMTFPPNASIWRSFLDGCNRQRSIEDLSLQIQAC